MKQRFLFLSLFFLCQVFAKHAGGQDTLSRSPTDTGLVRIFKDPRLDLLVEKQIEVNELTTRSGRRLVAGFRLLVINTKDRQEAINAKALLYEKFPELKSQLWHQTPYYKIKAGNFNTREGAEVYEKRLRLYFPKGVFIMTDVIDTYFLNDPTPPGNNKKK